jgi:hypothetical protein
MVYRSEEENASVRPYRVKSFKILCPEKYGVIHIFLTHVVLNTTDCLNKTRQ